MSLIKLWLKCSTTWSLILTHYGLGLLTYTPWKHQKPWRFSDAFRGYRWATPDCDVLIIYMSLKVPEKGLSIVQPSILLDNANLHSAASLTHPFPMHPFYTPWKHQITLPFSDVFRGYTKDALGTNELSSSLLKLNLLQMGLVSLCL